MEKRIYRPLEQLSQEDIERIINDENLDELRRLPLSVGQYHLNWKIAQDICAKLCEHTDPWVRANAVLGFAYIARTKGKLEKHIVKPLILKELRENKEVQWRIKDAIDDIDIFLKWNLGKMALEKVTDKI